MTTRVIEEGVRFGGGAIGAEGGRTLAHDRADIAYATKEISWA